VEKNASAKEIQKAYKSYCLTFHADKQGNDPEARKIADDLIRRANEAKEVLLDAQKRKIYDALGPNGFKQISLISEKGRRMLFFLFFFFIFYVFEMPI
jgi:curved DNA-binding protein